MLANRVGHKLTDANAACNANGVSECHPESRQRHRGEGVVPPLHNIAINFALVAPGMQLGSKSTNRNEIKLLFFFGSRNNQFQSNKHCFRFAEAKTLRLVEDGTSGSS